MAKVDLLAPSRAGDKFHYYWAARKTLELLRPGTTRTEIVVEGRSPSDRETDADEVIDVAEYFTSEAPQRVIYSQLKHSTRRLTTEWTISDFRRCDLPICDSLPRPARHWFDLDGSNAISNRD